MFDFIRFCDDFSVDYRLCGGDWANIDCPIAGCKCEGKKGGFNLSNSFYSCYRCGRHSKTELIQAITGFNWEAVYPILKTYTSNKKAKDYYDNLSGFDYRPIKVELPLFSKPIKDNKKACAYLERRGFDVYDLEDKYGILATNALSNVPHAIVIPIFFQGRLVSYTSRSYLKTVDKAKRYCSCSKDKEVINHKSILYNWDSSSDTIIVVEGCTDVWRLGDSTVACFGSTICPQQISLIKKKKKCYIAFDNEPMAQKKAYVLMNSLCLFIAVENILIPFKDKDNNYKDPGEFNNKEVIEFRDFCGI